MHKKTKLLTDDLKTAIDTYTLLRKKLTEAYSEKKEMEYVEVMIKCGKTIIERSIIVNKEYDNQWD